MAKGRKLGDPVKRHDNRRNRNRGKGGDPPVLKATPSSDPANNTKKLDEEQLLTLAEMDCTVEEIAAVMKCSKKHLQRYYRHIITQGREQGKASLRRFQFDAARRGNPALLIWLGKQRLNQKDKHELEIDKNPLVVLVEQMRAESQRIGMPEGKDIQAASQ
jgi:hypothetical protein